VGVCVSVWVCGWVGGWEGMGSGGGGRCPAPPTASHKPFKHPRSTACPQGLGRHAPTAPPGRLPRQLTPRSRRLAAKPTGVDHISSSSSERSRVGAGPSAAGARLGLRGARTHRLGGGGQASLRTGTRRNPDGGWPVGALAGAGLGGGGAGWGTGGGGLTGCLVGRPAGGGPFLATLALASCCTLRPVAAVCGSRSRRPLPPSSAWGEPTGAWVAPLLGRTTQPPAR
jgi:hypothetical protein